MRGCDEGKMNITIEQVHGTVNVSVLVTHGDIDASNYLELVQKAQELVLGGEQNLLLDLGDSPFLSSSGLVALHSIALLLRGKKAIDPESGWDAIHAMENDLENGIQKHIKLLNPQARVERTLERTGLKQFFEIFTDRAQALASFRPHSTEEIAA
jgi:anti-anti-sigma regulatory factor